MRIGLALLVALAGCATAPPEPPPEPARPQAGENVAVARLMEDARAEAQAGRLAQAAARLERALRIEPRNARLWHELAAVRLRQGDFAQAENLAARSNAWAGGDSALRDANHRLIAEARAAARR